MENIPNCSQLDDVYDYKIFAHPLIISVEVDGNYGTLVYKFFLGIGVGALPGFKN